MRRAAKWIGWILVGIIALPVLLVAAVLIGANTDAGRHAIERLKVTVPIWKKEFARSGAVWLEGPAAHPA